MIRTCLAFCILCWGYGLKGQVSSNVVLADGIMVTENGQVLSNAFSGGINVPFWGKADLDRDGHEDLVVAEKRASGEDLIITTFRFGPNGYLEDKRMAINFPTLWNLMVLVDFNCDQIPDIFTYSQPNSAAVGYAVYRGFFDGQNRLAFALDKHLLTFYDDFGGGNPIPFNAIDLPSFTDIDNDGDLDILMLTVSSGGHIEMFECMSQELGHGCDSLIYRYADDCWGRLQEPDNSNLLILSPSRDSCPDTPGWSPVRSMHGGSTLLHLDIDGDLDKEAIVGDALSTSLVMVINGGDLDTAFAASTIDSFPVAHPANIFQYPAAFHLDIDNDGDKDLLVSPHFREASESKDVAWFYENTGSDLLPIFTFRQTDFLVNSMIDHGEDASPAFFDVDQDGLMDILVGNKGYQLRNGQQSSQLMFLKNVGTATNPSYSIVNDDFLGLSAYAGQSDFVALSPAWGDMDADGDMDLLFGNQAGGIIFFKNISGASQPMQFDPPVLNWNNIDVGAFSTPLVLDGNADGLPDLLVGERDGNLNYFENTGSHSQAVFNQTLDPNGNAEPTNQYAGGVNTNPTLAAAYSRPSLAHTQSGSFLFTSGYNGKISLYENVLDAQGRLNSVFSLLDASFGGIDAGYRSLCDVADINADGKLDYVVGNSRGGLAIYSEGVLETALAASFPVEVEVSLFPNPTSGIFQISSQAKLSEVLVFDLIGNCLSQQNNTCYDISHLEKGMYIVKVIFCDNSTKVLKVIKGIL